MATINTPDTLKMVREALCRAQSNQVGPGTSFILQRLIADIDRQRPLGPDGKHGSRHTRTCGCGKDRPLWLRVVGVITRSGV